MSEEKLPIDQELEEVKVLQDTLELHPEIVREREGEAQAEMPKPVQPAEAQPGAGRAVEPEPVVNDAPVVVSLRDVYKSYSQDTPALNGVSLDIRQGEFVFIIGDSGSGKSTLIKLLLRELEADKGSINVLGYDLRKIRHGKIPKFRRNLGVVFQDFRLLKDRSVYENVAFAQRIVRESSANIRRNVPRILAMVGLADKYRNKTTQLSGGEQQRVALARALVNEPLILLADEPTGNLDDNNAWDIMHLLEEINASGTTVVVVTHNQKIVDEMQKRVIRMEMGSIVHDEEESGYHEN